MRYFFPVSAITVVLGAALLSGCGGDVSEEKKDPGMAQEQTAGVPVGELTPEQQKEVIDALMRTKAQEQAQGLGGGKVVVNGAWNYEGYSYLSPDPNAAIEARLVAVDLTISGHTQNFDVDDIEIVDGASLLSYGSDPHAEPLNREGKLLGQGDVFPAAPEANRWLLIYAYPKASPAFRLYYWGQELSGDDPVKIADSGWELPHPPAETVPLESAVEE
ncbi:MAG: hypothetical protein MI807_06860 [Verrucomicrobiales bacterium]|nr:hypothetical protein [Verrucomicrobiales bacterium]